MATVNYTPITDEEAERIRRETAESDARSPRVERVHYDAASGRLVLEMVNGATVSVVAREVRGLTDATDSQLADVQAMYGGVALHWDEIDVQMSTIALLSLIFNLKTVNEVASRAGKTRTAAKSAAARENGKKGGRPRKAAAV